jgi:hypothetical protein
MFTEKMRFDEELAEAEDRWDEQQFSQRSSAAELGFFLDATPERPTLALGDTSPSESLHTVVAYNVSFETPQERMDFALKVLPFPFLLVSRDQFAQQRNLMAQQLGIPPETILIDEVTSGSPNSAVDVGNDE